MRKKLDFEEDELELKHILEDLNAVGRLTDYGLIDYETFLRIKKEVMSYIGEQLAPNLLKGRQKK
jgi:hypothetical protein